MSFSRARYVIPNIPGTPGDDILYGTDDDDTITGIGGNDRLFGFGGDDLLDGGDGNDILDGGTGADTMAGGIGDDFYVVDNLGDVVVEDANGGSDLVFTTIDYTLGDNLERLAVYSRASTFTINLTGNALANELIGNNGANFLDGGAGADIMQGGEGDDTYVVDNGGDRTLEVSGANSGIDTVLVRLVTANTLHGGFDYSNRELVSSHVSALERFGVFDAATTNSINIFANSLANVVTGNAGINVLDGWIGGDTMAGYGGDDYYFVDNAGDVVIEASGEGYDTIYLGSSVSGVTSGLTSYTLPNNVERLIAQNSGGNTPNFTLTGNQLDNEIVGNVGNNIIDGGVGADIMRGRLGDDTYVVDNAGDLVIEGEGGLDTVLTSIDYILPQDVEQLRVNGASSTFAINLTGNESVNDIVGNDGANVIDGKVNADTMHGLGGDDIYLVDNAGDVVDEAAGAGLDTVYVSGTNYTLAANVERLIVNGSTTTSAINLTGNGLDNEIKGNDGANLIDGGFGIDILQGYGGADTFAFTSILVGADNADQIVDFETGLDKIALDDAIFTLLAPGALAAGSFHAGAGAQDADDRIIYDPTTGKLFYDTDGNGAAEQIHFATLHEGLSLTASEFQVI